MKLTEVQKKYKREWAKQNRIKVKLGLRKKERNRTYKKTVVDVFESTFPKSYAEYLKRYKQQLKKA
jgi:hypothetical protein